MKFLTQVLAGSAEVKDLQNELVSLRKDLKHFSERAQHYLAAPEELKKIDRELSSLQLALRLKEREGK